MRFTAAVASSSLLALTLAAPQGTSSEVESCISDCPDGDVGCVATCVGVPNPNEADANANTECAEQCDQGDGSPEDTEAYGLCLAQCADTFILTTGNAPAPSQTVVDLESTTIIDEVATETETDTEVVTETETDTELATETETDTDIATETELETELETDIATETETEIVDATDVSEPTSDLDDEDVKDDEDVEVDGDDENDDGEFVEDDEDATSTDSPAEATGTNAASSNLQSGFSVFSFAGLALAVFNL